MCKWLFRSKVAIADKCYIFLLNAIKNVESSGSFNPHRRKEYLILSLNRDTYFSAVDVAMAVIIFCIPGNHKRDTYMNKFFVA